MPGMSITTYQTMHTLDSEKVKHRYQAVFESISKKFDELLHVKLSPKVIKVDFEQTVISAIQQCFPEAKVNGCNFHFKQSLYRRVQHEGLVQDYRENTEVPQHIRMVAIKTYLKSVGHLLKLEI